MEHQGNEKSGFFSWLIVLVIILIILIQGVYAFKVVGDLGQPEWDYRPVKDVPGESPYAMYELLPYAQHVRGEKGE